MGNYPDYEDFEERIDRAVRQRKCLLRYIMLGTSTFLYVLFMALMWGIFLTDEPIRSSITDLEQVAGLLVLPTVGWLVSLILIGIAQIADARFMEEFIRRDIMGRELSQQLVERYMAEQADKAKRHDSAHEEPYVTVSDDGELIPLERDPDSDADEPRQQRR